MNYNDLENNFINNEIKFYDLSTIFFDSPIHEDDINKIKEIFFSLNNINQIYFIKNIDIKSIDIIKYLLEISPTMNDTLVEKYIFDLNSEDLDSISELNFFNPNTWFLSMIEFNKQSSIVSLDKYRQIRGFVEIFNRKLENDSPLEKIKNIYDFCKDLSLVDNSVPISDMLKRKEASVNDFSILFHYLLSKNNINSFVGKASSKECEYNVVIVDVKDKKYNIDGIYLFDPFSDSVSKDEVIDEDLRNINYNFFGITLKQYEKNVFSDKFIDVISCLTHDYEYDLEKSMYISGKSIRTLEECFKMDYHEIHKRIEQTKEIDLDTKLKIITSNCLEKLKELIEVNYKKRQDEIFDNNSALKLLV